MGSWSDLRFQACISSYGVGLKANKKATGYPPNICDTMVISCQVGYYCGSQGLHICLYLALYVSEYVFVSLCIYVCRLIFWLT